MKKEKVEYDKRCIICKITQKERAKEVGGLFIAVFPTDADKKYKGKPQPICPNCFRKWVK